MSTVTVRKDWQKFTLEFSDLPGQKFGPWGFAEACRDLRVSALLSPMDARNLVVDASVHGSATTEVSR